jgi:hypothetical protein
MEARNKHFPPSAATSSAANNIQKRPLPQPDGAAAGGSRAANNHHRPLSHPATNSVKAKGKPNLVIPIPTEDDEEELDDVEGLGLVRSPRRSASLGGLGKGVASNLSTSHLTPHYPRAAVLLQL